MNIRKNILVVLLVGSISVCFVGRATAANPDLISDAEALSKFVAAGAAYKAENYDKAIATYEEILRGGKESGALYYNLGNSYFKKGSPGKAILNYERARRLIPRDSDLNFNAGYARSKAGVPEASGGFSAQLVEPRIRNWTDREIAWAWIVITLAGAAVHLLSLFGKWPLMTRRHAIVLVCALWLVCLGGFAVKFAAEENLAVTIVPGEAKFEPREDATVHFPLGEGTMVKVLEAEDAWAKIRRDDGKVGWVPEKVFERF